MNVLNDDSPPLTPADPLPVNEVRLIGYLSKPLEIKEMPSGDLLGKWTLVVRRPQRVFSADEPDQESSAPKDKSAKRRRQSHDTIDCISFDLDLVELLSDVEPRTQIEVRGALRRRFRKDQPGQSQYEVEAFRVTLLCVPVLAQVAAAGESAARDHPADSVQTVGTGEAVTAGG